MFSRSPVVKTRSPPTKPPPPRTTLEMNFPQELIDEILDHMPMDNKRDRQSLQSCSLVAKSWIDPSRRRLFETVLITNTNRRLWQDKISPTNTELLRHVRSLFYVGYYPRDSKLFPKYTNTDDLYPYFPSFRQLHDIIISSTRISSDIPEQIEMFSSCQQVLSSLALCDVSLQWRSFIALIDCFPNLRNLELQCLSFEDENRNPPPLSRPLHGTLSFYLSEEKNLAAFFDWFARLEVEYEELVVDLGEVSAAYSQCIIDTCRETLMRLELETLPSAPPSLLNCPELHELRFSALYPTRRHEDTISSITSINFWKIAFSSYSSVTTLHAFADHPRWPSFDNCISALADRLRKAGNRRTLEVEFRFGCMTPDPPVGDTEFLPKFKEKGRVRIVN